MSDQGRYPSTRRVDQCGLTSVRRVAAMLDLDPEEFCDRVHLPRGWHFFLLGGETRRSSLRNDGFPGFGVSMPDYGMPRLLLAGRTVSYSYDITIGSQIERSSSVQSITEKASASGPAVVVKVQHDLRPLGRDMPAITESQTYVLLGGKAGKPPSADQPSPIEGEYLKTVTPDQTLLFQYSALGFNSHRIHLDRSFARDIEGLPDLVVNGGLTTLFLTEFLRNEIGVTPKEIRAKYTAPLYCGRPISLSASCHGERWRLAAYGDGGVMAVEVEAGVE